MDSHEEQIKQKVEKKEAARKSAKGKKKRSNRVLVIKLSALGDFVQAMAAFKSIRDYHEGDYITLLTTDPYVALAEASPYFDEVWSGGRPNNSFGVLPLIAKIRKRKFYRVYDLQTSGRTNFYYQMLWPFRPEWSGVALGCSHPHKNPNRGKMHTIDRQAEQLAMLGVGLGRGRVGGTAPPPDLTWMDDVQKGAARTELNWFGVRKPYALLVPGSAPHRPGKRWKAEYFGDLAMKLRRAGVMPVILGTDADKDVAFVIQRVCPGALSLINRTDFIQIVVLARQANLAIGNDTGPMHLIASANCPSVVLFSDSSDPDRCAPRGLEVTVIKKRNLQDLGPGELWETMQMTGKLEFLKDAPTGQKLGDNVERLVPKR